MSVSVKYNLFADPSHTELYAQFRPDYPDELFHQIVSYLKEGQKSSAQKTVCVDIGCGSGQATQLLTKYFDHVIGVEPSKNQINNAPKHERIQYVVASSEKTGLDDACADAITVAQAFHWFDIEEFFKEVDRVLKPNGVLAVWCYVLNHFDNNEANQVLRHFYDNQIHTYWSDKRKLVDDHYESIQFPYPSHVKKLVVTYSKNLTLDHYIGYLSTWSAVNNYRQKHGEEMGNQLLNELKGKLQKALNVKEPSKDEISIKWDMYLIMTRKSP